jgi:competence protein ComEC
MMAAALVAGAALQLQQSALWPLAYYAGLGLVALLAMTHFYRSLLTLCLCAIIGFAWTGGRAAWFDAERLDPALEGRDVQIVGLVREMTHSNAVGLRFRLEVESATLDGQRVRLPPRIDLGWYRGMAPRTAPTDLGDWDVQKQPQTMAPGERWRMTVRVKAPHGSLNFQGFDYELWLWEQGVQATGYVRAGARDAPPQRMEATARYPVEQARQRVRDHILAAVPEPGQAALLAALVVGDQSALDQQQWALFRATGVAHLVSISGLHITMFAWAARWLIGWLWRRSQRLCLWWPAPSAAWLGGLLVACAYALFAGWGIPAQRTCIMLAWVTVLRLSGARWPWPNVWILALVLVVAYDPWSLLQPGFWLSFVAVAVLFATDAQNPVDHERAGAAHALAAQRQRGQAGSAGASQARVRWLWPWRRSKAQDAPDPRDDLFAYEAQPQPAPGRLARLRAWLTPPLQALRVLVREQGLITLALAPLSIVLFGQLSLVGLLANVVAVPWVTLVLTPLALAGVVLEPLWQWAALAAAWWMALVQTMAGWPLAVLALPVPPWWLALPAGLGALVLAMPLPWTVRCMGLPLLLALGAWRPPAPPPGQFALVAADIGQGNAVLVRTHGHTLLYDAGPRYSLDSDAGQRVIVPMLQAGVTRLDRLMLSHRDSDHVGGAASVLAVQPQADVWSSLEAGHAVLQGREHTRCQAGQSWEWDGVRFSVLHPAPEAYSAHSAPKPNTLSCVLRVQASAQDGVIARSALLVGDIEQAQEAQLLARAAASAADASLKADLLLVPHHGSKTSSSAAFLAAVHPQTAVVQAGYRNRYGHPAPVVVQRYAELAQGYALDAPLQWVDTPHCGAFAWQSWQPASSLCARQVLQRYWHHRVP